MKQGIRWTKELLEQKLKAGTIAGYQLPQQQESKKKGNKYRNKPICVDGIWFQSTKEGNRYRKLVLLQKLGEISGLRRQVRYLVIEATDTTNAAYYDADFVYFLKGEDREIVEDVKSEKTRKLPTYILKKKLMKTVHGIDIKET